MDIRKLIKINIGVRKSLFFILLLFFLVGSLAFYKIYPKYQAYLDAEKRKKDAFDVELVIEAEGEREKEKEEIVKVEPEGEEEILQAPPSPSTIAESAVITVPYTVQAPFRSWTLHQESCEEAAVLMYDYYLKGITSFSGSTVIPQQGASDDMVTLKNWQVANYGSEPDLTIEALGKFMKDYYNYNYQVFKNITKDDIKREITNGNPVLVPVITHGLENPHYSRQPSYHILFIKGYKSTGVITNDAGISQGENYFYTWDTLFSAIDAQTSQMGQGREMVIITK